MEWVVIIVYGVALTFIFCYSLIQLQLVIKYRQYKKLQRDRLAQKNEKEFLPKITVQLPIFNEKYVVNRLIDALALQDYPRELFEIQILDDSTDETITLSKAKAEEWRLKGINIDLIQREDRTGFKAGALAHGLKLANGEFIAIFDADFIPYPDFLRKTIQELRSEEVGMVQTKWKHINEEYSLLTKLQAFGLDAHFSVEQGGRNAGGHFINFNGTAGIWRKQTIIDAGGWQSDTLTEDLDLSYRAQLNGWKFKFIEEIGAPAELPAEMNALKTQQFRWNKGAAECVRKNLHHVLKSDRFSFGTKMNAIFHLMNSSIFICIVIISVLSVPLLFIKSNNPDLSLLFKLASLFVLCVPILALFYYSSFKQTIDKVSFKTFLQFVVYFPLFLAVSMGLSLHNAIAVAEGYLGKKTPFIRTPKFNLDNNRKKSWRSNVYLKKSLNPLTLLELLLAGYFFYGIICGIQLKDYGLLPFHLMLFFGFAYVPINALIHAIKAQR